MSTPPFGFQSFIHLPDTRDAEFNLECIMILLKVKTAPGVFLLVIYSLLNNKLLQKC
jgi:hypothetical protein